MYCLKCGKKILESDKFCPYCGTSQRKKVIIDTNSSAESLIKRGFLYAEDGDFESAKDYFDRALDQAPENAEAYLGKLLIQKKKHSKEELYDYYKELFAESDEEMAEVPFSKEEEKHIGLMCEKYCVPGYLEKSFIENEYRQIDRYYLSPLAYRNQQKQKIQYEFQNDRDLNRAFSFADGQLKKELDGIVEEYDRRIREASKDDRRNEKAIQIKIPELIREKDEEIERQNRDALQRREIEYQESVTELESVNSLDRAKELMTYFEKLLDYKEAPEYREKCRQKVGDLEKKAKEEEEAERKRNRKRVMMAVAALVLLVALYVVYQQVIVPDNIYKTSVQNIEKGEYDEAISGLVQLNGYKDSEDKLKEARYKKALLLLNNGDYQEAIDLLVLSESYEESAEKIIEAKYGLGLKNISDGKYDEAILLLQTIADYGDAPEKILEAKYRKAIFLREEKQFDDSISLFSELGDYLDSADQLKQTESAKADNCAEVPKIIGKSLSDAKEMLSKADLKYTVKESEAKDQKVGTVVDSDPRQGTTVYKGTTVTITVAKGSSKYSNYDGDANTVALFQINITSAGNNLRIRKAPTTGDDNKIRNAKTGEVYNVYEKLVNEGYTWYRIGNQEWVANDQSWTVRDTVCDSNDGDFSFVTAKINVGDNDHISIYNNPVENENQRQWVGSIYNGEIVTVYYRFYNGSHMWYKVGANKWVKDMGGDRIIIQ